MPTLPHGPFIRADYLKTVPAAHRAIADLLCDALERVFGRGAATLYAGFPVVVREGEWFGGFAIRKSGPVAYCCSPGAKAKHGKALAPFMQGKSCVAVKAIAPGRSKALPGGATTDEIVSLVERAWRTTKTEGGMMSKAERTKRERAKAAANAPPRKPAARARRTPPAKPGAGASAMPTSKRAPRSAARR